MRSAGSTGSVGLLRVRSGRGQVEELATRLRSAARPGDTMAVVAPATFVVLCERLGDAEDLLAIAHRVEALLSEPPGLDPVLDVALVDPHERDPTSLLGRRAASASVDVGVDVGQLGSGSWWRFGDLLRRRASERELVEAALRRTSDGRDLVLEYQPERNLRSGRIVGVEALVRWVRGDRVVGPDAFVPVAERTGLIVAIGAWVLGEACEQLARWRRAGLADAASVAVNVSPRQLLDDGFVGVVDDALDAAAIPADDLVLELTEGVLLADLDTARARLDELRGRGVRVAIDDFGTGFASLTYLHRLPVDVVKLDRSFVDGLGVDERLTSIVAAVLRLTEELGLESIAEGVATGDQAERLRVLGCHVAQGSWVGAPAPASTLAGRLRS